MKKNNCRISHAISIDWEKEKKQQRKIYRKQKGMAVGEILGGAKFNVLGDPPRYVYEVARLVQCNGYILLINNVFIGEIIKINDKGLLVESTVWGNTYRKRSFIRFKSALPVTN